MSVRLGLRVLISASRRNYLNRMKFRWRAGRVRSPIDTAFAQIVRVAQGHLFFSFRTVRLVLLVLATALFLTGCKSGRKIGAREDREYVPITEKAEERPKVTPTPIPKAPIHRPLDPTGRPP